MHTTMAESGALSDPASRSSRAKISSFSRNVIELMERAEYRRCESGEDLEAIYRLRYDAYRTHGFVSESPDRVTKDEFDGSPNCYRFGVFIGNELVSTVRLHYIDREHPVGPIMSAFGDVLLPRIERGDTFINPTLFASSPHLHSAYRALPYVTLRLAVIANSYFDATSCVCVIREEHTGFYHRIFGSSQVGDPRAYPPFSVPVMLYASECSENLQPTLQRFPFFASTPLERRLLFAEPTREGELAPLTIIPSTRFVRHAA